MSSLRSFAAILVIAGLAGACTSSGGVTTAPTQAAASQTAPSQAAGSQAAASVGGAAVVVITGTSSTLGTYLIGPKGRTLYTHSGDSPSTSTCTGPCAVAWPPLLVSAGAQASGDAGVTGAFGTLTRADGSVQVTYLGNPLYYWKGDTKAGDTTGEDVNGFLVAGVAGPISAPDSSIKPGY